jgi:hypothetical protein
MPLLNNYARCPGRATYIAYQSVKTLLPENRGGNGKFGNELASSGKPGYASTICVFINGNAVKPT